MSTAKERRHLTAHAWRLAFLPVALAACSSGERPAPDSAAGSGAATPRALAGPAARETCPGRSPTREFAGDFATARGAAQRAYLGALSFEATRPSADSVRVPSAPGSADSVSLRFEPEACSNHVGRSRDLSVRGRVVGRVTVAGAGRFPALGIRTAADTVYWWVGPAGKDTVRSFFVRVGDPATHMRQFLVRGSRASLPAPQIYAQVRFFHDSVHGGGTPAAGGAARTGADGGLMSREKQVGANRWIRRLALQDDPAFFNPWFACDLDCCTTNDSF